MNKPDLRYRKLFSTSLAGLVVLVGALVTSSLYLQPVSAQAANSMYLAPASGSYPVGSTFTVSVRENSSTPVNAAQADLSYSTAALEFVSLDGSGSAFGVDANSTGGNGSISISRGSTSGVSGDQLVAKVTFKALAITSASVQMQSSSVVLSTSTNTNVINARSGGTYTLTTPAGTTPPSPAPSPSPKPSPSPSPTPSPSPSTGHTTTPPAASKSTSASAVTIAPQGNKQTTALPGDSVVELSTPATVQATPAKGDVAKVEYFVNGKLVATKTSAPYTYSVDTTKYRNGKYTLTTRTQYKDGTIDSSNASLVVTNPFGPAQAWLQIRHYAWILLVVIVLIVGLLRFRAMRGGRKASAVSDDYREDSSLGFGPAREALKTPPQTTPYIAPAPVDPTVTVSPTPKADPAPAPAPVPAPAPAPAPVTPPADVTPATPAQADPVPVVTPAAPAPAPAPAAPTATPATPATPPAPAATPAPAAAPTTPSAAPTPPAGPTPPVQ